MSILSWWRERWAWVTPPGGPLRPVEGTAEGKGNSQSRWRRKTKGTPTAATALQGLYLEVITLLSFYAHL